MTESCFLVRRFYKLGWKIAHSGDIDGLNDEIINEIYKNEKDALIYAYNINMNKIFDSFTEDEYHGSDIFEYYEEREKLFLNKSYEEKTISE